jgi:hypothetical protein
MDEAPIQAPATEQHNCPQCGTILNIQDRFCRSCGLEQRTAAVDTLIARIFACAD